MVSIWGLIALLQRSFNVEGGNVIVPRGIEFYAPVRTGPGGFIPGGI